MVFEEATRLLRFRTPEDEHLVRKALGDLNGEKLAPNECHQSRAGQPLSQVYKIEGLSVPKISK